MPQRSNVHVTKDGGGWKVSQAGSKISSHRTQANAIQAARTEARRYAVDLVIHRRDGRIRCKDSYGPDPNGRSTPSLTETSARIIKEVSIRRGMAMKVLADR